MELYIINLLAFLLFACGATIWVIIRQYRKSLK